MNSETATTFQSSTIERLRFHTAHVYIANGCITIVGIASETGHIRECVPEKIESVETLQYLGLTRCAALEAYLVFAHESQSPTYVKTEFVEWARKHVEKFPDCSEDDAVSVWEDAMRIMGLQTLGRDAILHPRFAKLRQEHTARYWVIQTMEDKWKHLVELDQKIKSDLAEIEAAKHQIE